MQKYGGNIGDSESQRAEQRGVSVFTKRSDIAHRQDDDWEQPRKIRKKRERTEKKKASTRRETREIENARPSIRVL